jgi:hypothetical protein
MLSTVMSGSGNAPRTFRVRRLIVFDLNEYWSGLIKDVQPKIAISRLRNMGLKLGQNLQSMPIGLR